jgi:hypothetical protein
MGKIDSIHLEQPERMLATYSAIDSNVPAAVIQLNRSLLRAAMSDAQVEWEQFEKTGKNLQDFLRTQKSLAPAGKTLLERPFSFIAGVASWLDQMDQTVSS